MLMKRQLLLVLLLSITTIGWCQSRTFQNPAFLPTAGDPAALASGDWNGDGKQDLAYIDDSANPSLHVLLGNGDGTFSPGQTLALPSGSCAYVNSTHACFLVPTDLNGDHKVDLIFLSTLDNSTATITALLGVGDGTFSTPIITKISASDSIPPLFETLPALGDFNGDGKTDLVVADFYGTVRCFLGDGAGGFTQTYQSNNFNSGTYAVYAGDFNRDGKLDFLAITASPFVAAVLYSGDGSGSFTPGPMRQVPGRGLVLADVNGDGIRDLITTVGANLSVMLGRSDGSFAPSQQIPSSLNNHDALVSVADINGDGIADLVLTTASGIEVLQGTGNLNFGPPQRGTAGSVSANALVVNDFNNDGIQDVIAGTAGGIVLLKGNASSNFATTTTFDTGKAINGMLVGDFNGDGLADLLVLQPSSTVQTFFGTSMGSLGIGPTQTLSGAPATNFGAAGDYDGDGKIDVAFGGNTMSVLFGSGDGSFLPISTAASMGAIRTADLNRDGKSDAISLTWPHFIGPVTYYELSSLLVAADRSFREVDTALLTSTYAPTLLGVGDLNHDGFPDAVVYDQKLLGFQIWLGNGDGSFRQGTNIPVPVTTLGMSTLSSGTQSYLVDMDGDGNLDLVLLGATSASGSTLLIFPGDGAGGLGSAKAIGLTHGYGGLRIADVNRDGMPDVVVWSANLLAVIPNLGGGNLGNEEQYVAGNQIGDVALADINGDGYPDIVVNYASLYFPNNVIAILLNEPSTSGSTKGSAQISLSVSPSTAAYNQPLTMTGVVSAIASGQPMPTGTLQFSINHQNIGTATVQSGTATIVLPGSFTQTLPTGVQSVAAVYSGDSKYGPAIANVTLNLLAPIYTTVSNLTSSATGIQAGQFIVLSVAITAPATVQNGIVTFYDGQSILGQTTVSQTGTGELQTNLLAIGTNTLTAVYNGFTPPAGAIGFSPALFRPSISVPIVVTVSALPTTTSLSTSTTSAVLGTVVTLTAKVSSSSVPFGGVTFFDAAAPLGTMALDSTGTAAFSTTSLGSGQHTLFASYAPTDPFAGSASVTTPVLMHATMGGEKPTHVLIQSVSASTHGSGLTLNVLIDTGTGPATGQVTLLRDNRVVAQQLVSAGGTASFEIAGNTSSAHSFYASYSGDTSFAASASPRFVSTDYTSATDFTLQATTEAASAASFGKSVLISVTGVGIWSQTVELSCGEGVPAGFTCKFTPASIGCNSQSVLTLIPVLHAPFTLAGGLSVGALLCFLRRKRLRSALCLTTVLVALAGCGSIGTSNLPQSPIVTVQGTAGTVTHAVQVLLH